MVTLRQLWSDALGPPATEISKSSCSSSSDLFTLDFSEIAKVFLLLRINCTRVHKIYIAKEGIANCTEEMELQLFRELYCSGLLRSQYWQFLTDVSG